MNEEQYLQQLRSDLRKLPTKEIDDIVNDFAEHFSFARDAGKEDREIVKDLGSPKTIAKEMLATYRIDQLAEKRTASNAVRAVWAVIALGFFNLVIVLGPFVALAAVIFSGWVVGFAFIISPLLALLNPIIVPGTFELVDLFLAILASGIGIFIIMGMRYATRVFTNGLLVYLNFNIKLVKGGVKH